jgi:putative membrane protein
MGPALLDATDDMPTGRIDHGWEPRLLRPPATVPNPLTWVAGGLGLLILGWLVLSAAGFVQDQFARSEAMGWVTLVVFSAALLAILWGLWSEARALRRLQQVEVLRSLLCRDDAPIAPARTLALEWLNGLGARIPIAPGAHAAVNAAADIPQLRATLHRHLAEPLRQATRQAGNRAALESGVVVAISPSLALDGVLAGLRGVSLLREVAAIHGMRPGAAVTLGLLRRVAWTAAGTSGMDLLAQTLADGALSHLPGLKQLAAAALPGAGLTAFRLRRLAEVAAMACSPVYRP